MKKLIALLLCLVMVVSVLAGCGAKAPVANNGGNEGAANNGGNSNIPDDVVLTIGIPQNGKVEDYDTNAYTLWLEEVTGYDLQFRVYQGTAADYKSQLSVSLVDGEELPDMLIGFDLGTRVYEEYGEDGYFIDMKPYFDDKTKSQVWWDRFAQLEDQEWQDYIWDKMVSNVDGGIYAFPRLESTPYDCMSGQVFINQDWLTALNLEMPTDTESLYQVLKAFKTKDPNGNGKADEVPIIGTTGNYGDTITWLVNMFVYMNKERFWRVDDQGQLYHIYGSDEYREALIFINKLVKEGLLPSSIWTMDSNAVRNMLAPGDNVQTVGIFVGHPTLSLAVNNENAFSYVAMPYWGHATILDQANSWNTFITEDCDYPDAAWNLLMVMASEEGSYRLRYGQKGVDWVEADPDTVSYLNLPATLKIINEGAYTDMGNECWKAIVATILLNAENEACQLSDDMNDWLQHKMGMMLDCYNYFYEAVERNPDNIVGVLDYSVEEDEYVNVSRSNTQGFINQCMASFCTGSGKEYNDPNNDAQWAAYLKGIEAQDIATWQEVAQDVYDWQYAGK